MSPVTLVGLESKIKVIWSWIMEEKLRMIAVIGVGGVGKTTLLRQIHDLLSGTGSYSFVIWVTVSGDFQIGKVQDEIWGKIGSLDEKWMENSTEQKANCIFHVLSQNNFVLFLDDLWYPIDLFSVGFPDPRTLNESIVILSSRYRFRFIPMGVQRYFELDVLTDDVAWALFQMKVGEDILNGHPYIMGAAKQISSLCSGLPMLLCTVAGAMARCKAYPEWKLALEALNQDVEQNKRHLLFLNFCYNYLPGDLFKFCFLYFSLFPEDFSIPKSDLIDFWISEEFFGYSNRKETALNLGRSIVDVLLKANLLEEENDNCVKMLDLIRDFALSLLLKFDILDAQFYFGLLLPSSRIDNSDLDLTMMSNMFGAQLVTVTEEAYRVIGRAPSNEQLRAGRILSMKNIIQNIPDVTPIF